MRTFEPLTAAENFVLLKPDRADPREALKIGLLGLAALGAIRFSSEDKIGLFRMKTTSRVHDVPEKVDVVPQCLKPLMSVARRASYKGGEMRELAKLARADFGPNLAGFTQKGILPALIERGLVEEELKPLLLVFTRRGYKLTPAGEMEQGKLLQTIERARQLPKLLNTDPKEAAAIILACGSALLLVEELRPHYQGIGNVLKAQGITPDSGDPVSWSADSGPSGFGDGHCAVDLGALSCFDAGSLASLDTAISSFDTSFNSSFSDSGGGGDSGGGDSGGGGGD